jgi:hypothetical protein
MGLGELLGAETPGDVPDRIEEHREAPVADELHRPVALVGDGDQHELEARRPDFVGEGEQARDLLPAGRAPCRPEMHQGRRLEAAGERHRRAALVHQIAVLERVPSSRAARGRS